MLDTPCVAGIGDQRVQHRKKTVMAPGEMEQVLLKKADLQNIDFDTVTVTVEAGNSPANNAELPRRKKSASEAGIRETMAGL